MTSQAIRKSISSPEPASGPLQLDLLAGLTIAPSGPAPVPASRSARPAKAEASTTHGICGPTSFASSESVDRPLFSENRSQQRPASEPLSTKTCTACGEEKTLADFYRTKGSHASSTGYHARCKACCRKWQESYRTGSKEQRSASFRKYREKHRASVLVTAARGRAKQAGLAFDLDDWLPQLQARIDNGYCEMSGLPFRLDGGRTWDSPSLDRIIPELGYTITNVRVVLFALNVMMNTWGAEPVLQIASSVKAAREADANSLMARWEERLKERLSSIGSTESPLIWTQSVTPSGRPISRLAPWTPPTSGSGSIGAPWATVRASTGGPDFASETRPGAGADSLPTVIARLAVAGAALGHSSPAESPAAAPIAAWATPSVVDATGRGYQMAQGRKFLSLPGQMDERLSGPKSAWSTPRASDGEKGGPNQSFGAGGQPLPAQMHQASPRVTPSARDWKDSAGMATSATNPDGSSRSRIDQLPRQMAATAPHGPEQNGSPATTAKRGAPNPDFAFWLMGWPAEFRRGVLAATQSLPRSRRKSSAR